MMPPTSLKEPLFQTSAGKVLLLFALTFHARDIVLFREKKLLRRAPSICARVVNREYYRVARLI